MNIISGIAVFFIIWWTVLFAMIPLGVRTQDDADDVTLGTTSSAPSGSHMGKAVLRTTIVSVLIYGAFYLATSIYGWDFDDIPRMIPAF